jgi:hypothetical protein
MRRNLTEDQEEAIVRELRRLREMRDRERERLQESSKHHVRLQTSQAILSAACDALGDALADGRVPTGSFEARSPGGQIHRMGISLQGGAGVFVNTSLYVPDERVGNTPVNTRSI